MNAPALLDVDALRIGFGRGPDAAFVLDGVSFAVQGGETLALVGESGSGKSMTALAIAGLLPQGASLSGAIRLDRPGAPVCDLATLPERARRKLRGRTIGMVFQDPMGALNPALTILTQINEALVLHRPDLGGRAARRDHAATLLARTGIPDPDRALASHPHTLSGGMRQRVMIAIALSAAPALLIADEPTTALDAATRGRVLELLRPSGPGTGTLLITHDLGAAALLADRIAVMYAGRIVEIGEARAILDAPLHPYTTGLLGSLPQRSSLRPDARGRMRLRAIAGGVPLPRARPRGCAFAPRCAHARPECAHPVALRAIAPDRQVACIRLGAP